MPPGPRDKDTTQRPPTVLGVWSRRQDGPYASTRRLPAFLTWRTLQGVIGGGLHSAVVCSSWVPSHGFNAPFVEMHHTHTLDSSSRSAAILDAALPSLPSGRRPILSHFPRLSYSAAFPDPPAFASASDPHLMHIHCGLRVHLRYLLAGHPPSRPYR